MRRFPVVCLLALSVGWGGLAFAETTFHLEGWERVTFTSEAII